MESLLALALPSVVRLESALVLALQSESVLESESLSALVSVGVGVAVGVGVGVGVPPHRALINTAWKVLAARKVKSTGSAGLIGMNVTTTGINVPGVNAGIITTALTGVPTTVSDCNPVPALT